MTTDRIITEIDVPMPMRDGVILRADIARPDGAGPFPALLNRTPYKKSTDDLAAFVRAGYAVIKQDIRGRYASDGEFTVFSEDRTTDPEDGYDSIEWVARQPWCNGKVGTFGASYNAWAQYQLAKMQPPHLVAMSAASIPPELTDVDWPGAFKPARRLKWWFTNMGPDLRRRAGLPPPHNKDDAAAEWDDRIGDGIINRLPFIDLCEMLPPPLAEHARHWMQRPSVQPWKLTEAHRQIAVPNLDFTGWFDHCCSIDNFLGLRSNAATDLARTQTRIVIGPWNHGGVGQRALGSFDFGPEAEQDIQQIQIRWFDHWLKDEANGLQQDPIVRYFVMGSNRWKTSPTWPPPEAARTEFLLDSAGQAQSIHSPGTLSAEQPEGNSSDSFIYDPADPVPTLWEADWFSRVSDRSELNDRLDILRYRTMPLEQDLEITGNPEVVLHVSSDAPDTDFFARLVNEAPDGTAMEVCYGMIRTRHRQSLEREDPLVPGEVTELRIVMGITACRLPPDHMLRLEITSSDFPNHDRNHNTGRNDLLDPELWVAENTVWHTEEYPSRLVLPVVG